MNRLNKINFQAKEWNGLFSFFTLVDNLKRTYRYSQCETKKLKSDSAADHSWRLALMAQVLAKQLKLKINLAKALKLALIHDINEAVTGDIDYVLIALGKVKAKDKDKKERLAITKICGKLPPKIGLEIKTIWQDYSRGRSVEARFIKALDKLETMIYLIDAGYLAYCQPKVIPNYADKHVAAFPPLKPLLKEIKTRLKKEYRRGGIEWKREYD